MSIVVTESSEEIDGRGGVILHADVENSEMAFQDLLNVTGKLIQVLKECTHLLTREMFTVLLQCTGSHDNMSVHFHNDHVA